MLFNNTLSTKKAYSIGLCEKPQSGETEIQLGYIINTKQTWKEMDT